MEEELRTPKEYEEIDVKGDGCLVVGFLRVMQGIAGIVGSNYAISSYIETGISPQTLLWVGLTIGSILLIESKIREDRLETANYLNEPGVVDD